MKKSDVSGALTSSRRLLDGKYSRSVLLDLGAGLIVGFIAVTVSTAFAALIDTLAMVTEGMDRLGF